LEFAKTMRFMMLLLNNLKIYLYYPPGQILSQGTPS